MYSSSKSFCFRINLTPLNLSTVQPTSRSNDDFVNSKLKHNWSAVPKLLSRIQSVSVIRWIKCLTYNWNDSEISVHCHIWDRQWRSSESLTHEFGDGLDFIDRPLCCEWKASKNEKPLKKNNCRKLAVGKPINGWENSVDEDSKSIIKEATWRTWSINRTDWRRRDVFRRPRPNLCCSAIDDGDDVEDKCLRNASS